MKRLVGKEEKEDEEEVEKGKEEMDLYCSVAFCRRNVASRISLGAPFGGV